MIHAQSPAFVRLTRCGGGKPLASPLLSYPLITHCIPSHPAVLLPFWLFRTLDLHLFFGFSSTLKGRGFVPLDRLRLSV